MLEEILEWLEDDQNFKKCLICITIYALINLLIFI